MNVLLFIIISLCSLCYVQSQPAARRHQALSTASDYSCCKWRALHSVLFDV